MFCLFQNAYTMAHCQNSLLLLFLEDHTTFSIRAKVLVLLYYKQLLMINYCYIAMPSLECFSFHYQSNLFCTSSQYLSCNEVYRSILVLQPLKLENTQCDRIHPLAYFLYCLAPCYMKEQLNVILGLGGPKVL